MTPRSSHEEMRELLAAEALDALDAPERARLEAHLAGCPECSAELSALRDAAAALAETVPPRPVDPSHAARMRARLLARATADRAPPVAGASPIPGVRPLVIARAHPARLGAARVLAAAALILIGVGLAGYATMQRGRAHRLAQQLALVQHDRARVERQLAGKTALLDRVLGPRVSVIDAVTTGARAPSGRMYWDHLHDEWTFVAFGLPAARRGRTYQLWLVTAGQRKLSAGTFTPDSSGDALVQATYTLPADSLAAVAVTDEPAGGSPAPTTPPVLVGLAGPGVR